MGRIPPRIVNNGWYNGYKQAAIPEIHVGCGGSQANGHSQHNISGHAQNAERLECCKT